MKRGSRPKSATEALLLSPRDARAIFTYNRAVFDRFVRRLSRLPWKTVSAERQTGHHTLFETLVHILHVQEAWLAYIVPGRGEFLSTSGDDVGEPRAFGRRTGVLPRGEGSTPTRTGCGPRPKRWSGRSRPGTSAGP